MELVINAYSNLRELFSLKQPTFFKFIKQFFSRPQQPHHHHEYSEWRNLPSDILGKIINLLNVSDFTCMRYTCKSWWTESQWLLGNGGHLSLAPQHPWLLLPHDPTSPHLTFMDLFETKLRDIKLPISVREGWCCGSSKGWLFIAYGPELEPDLFLINPISGHSLPLPPISDIPGCGEFSLYLRHSYDASIYITKLVLSNSSPATSDCLVAGLIYGRSSIIFCKVGGDSWTLLGDPVDYDDDNIRFNDIVFSPDGTKLYILARSDGMTSWISVIQDDHSTLSQLEVTSGIHSSRISLFQTQFEVVLNFIPDSGGEALFGGLRVHNNFKILEKRILNIYLVETSKGKLFEVHKYMDVMINKRDPGLGDPEGVDEDDDDLSNIKYLTTTGFQVFSVDPDNGYKCRLYSLEDEDDVIFMGLRGSFSMSSRDFKAGLISSNCIYFLDDSYYECQDPNITRECGVFDLNTGKIKKCIPSIQVPIVSHMVWFTPNTF